jgi:outer membrane protein insertion porin family
LPVALSDHIAREGNATNTVMAFFNFEVDKSNGGYFPSSGYRLQNGNEFGKSGTVPYLKSVVSFEKFAGFGSGFSLRAHVRAGVGVTSGADQFPLFKNFRGGGLGSVRGFASGTLGPTSAIPGSTEVAHIGGVKSLVGGLEVSRNVAGRDDLFMTGFVDIGNVFGAGETVSASDLRQSVGVGVTWVGPIGPLNVSFAHPLNDSAGDKVELLQFSLGASF